MAEVGAEAVAVAEEEGDLGDNFSHTTDTCYKILSSLIFFVQVLFTMSIFNKHKCGKVVSLVS